MGKKKFIDKKKASSYALVFRGDAPPDDDGLASVDGFGGGGSVASATLRPHAGGGGAELPDAAERILVAKSARPGALDDACSARSGATADAGPRPPVPRDWWAPPPAPPPPTAAARAELMELGFPDDGYDYGRHLRALTPGGVAQAAGLQVITLRPSAGDDGAAPRLPPDVKGYDARRVARLADATRAPRAAARVAASARAELEAALAALDSGDESDQDAGNAGGESDLEDDFVVQAAAGGGGEGQEQEQEEEEREEEGDVGLSGVAAAAAAAAARRRALAAMEAASPTPGGDDDYGDEEEEEDDDEDDEDDDGDDGDDTPAPPRAPRPLDNDFAELALDYADSDIGDGGGNDNAAGARGDAALSDFGDVIQGHLGKGGGGRLRDMRRYAYQSAADAARLKGLDDADGADAAGCLASTKAGLRLAAGVSGSVTGTAIPEDCEDDAPPPGERWAPTTVAEDDPRERWDCETVTTLRSNTEHHPAVIGGAPTRRARRDPLATSVSGRDHATIVLSSKSGLPVGYVPSRGPRPGGDTAAAGQPTAAVAVVAPSRRPGHETAEEKKARKGAVKVGRRESRALKADTKAVFKTEGQRLQRAHAAQAGGASRASVHFG